MCCCKLGTNWERYQLAGRYFLDSDTALILAADSCWYVREKLARNKALVRMMFVVAVLKTDRNAIIRNSLRNNPALVKFFSRENNQFQNERMFHNEDY